MTPSHLELLEGPTELVRLYVKFAGQNGDMRKGMVLAWDGPDDGFSVMILGHSEVVKGVRSSDMLFLDNQEEVDMRSVPIRDGGAEAEESGRGAWQTAEA
jgi:hypothetical protein